MQMDERNEKKNILVVMKQKKKKKKKNKWPETYIKGDDDAGSIISGKLNHGAVKSMLIHIR